MKNRETIMISKEELEKLVDNFGQKAYIAGSLPPEAFCSMYDPIAVCEMRIAREDLTKKLEELLKNQIEPTYYTYNKSLDIIKKYPKSDNNE